MNRIEIPLSKRKASLLLIVPLILLISSPFSFLWPEWFGSSMPNDLEKTRFLGIAGGIVGLSLSIFIIRKWLTGKAGFIIDKSGITDVSSTTYTDLVEWEDITKVEGKKVGPLKFIILHTDKPEKYLNKAKKIARREMGKSLSFHGSPLLIVSSRLKIKYDDLLMLINSEFEKAKRTTLENKAH